MSASPIECSICFQGYTLRVFPVAGRCGHSICSNCIVQLTNSNCPICRGTQSFGRPVKNDLGHELVKQIILNGAPEGTAEKYQSVDRKIRELQAGIKRLEQHLSRESQSSPESDAEPRWERRAENPRFFQQRLIRRDRSPQEATAPPPPPSQPQIEQQMYPYPQMVQVPMAPVAYPFPVLSYPLPLLFPFFPYH